MYFYFRSFCGFDWLTIIVKLIPKFTAEDKLIPPPITLSHVELLKIKDFQDINPYLKMGIGITPPTATRLTPAIKLGRALFLVIFKSFLRVRA
jgi:hypothetical protein